MNYKLKPIVPVIIEAYSYTGDPSNPGWPKDWLKTTQYFNSKEGILFILTSRGYVQCLRGDYIVKGIKGDFIVCSPDVFKEICELID